MQIVTWIAVAGAVVAAGATAYFAAQARKARLRAEELRAEWAA
jgi:hypothetical protein